MVWIDSLMSFICNSLGKRVDMLGVAISVNLHLRNGMTDIIRTYDQHGNLIHHHTILDKTVDIVEATYD